MGPAVPIGAAGENFLKITYFLQIFNEILPLFTVCKGWTVYATGFWRCMPWHFRSLMAYLIATPLCTTITKTASTFIFICIFKHQLTLKSGEEWKARANSKATNEHHLKNMVEERDEKIRELEATYILYKMLNLSPNYWNKWYFAVYSTIIILYVVKRQLWLAVDAPWFWFGWANDKKWTIINNIYIVIAKKYLKLFEHFCIF